MVSLKFQKANSTSLTRTPSSAGNRSVYTGSVWIKRTQFAPNNTGNSNTHNHIIFSAGSNSGSNVDDFSFYKNAGSDDNKLRFQSYPGSTQYEVISNARFRDPNGWYNVTWSYDGHTAKFYSNGEEITSLDTNTQNGGSGGHFNNTVQHVIGRTCDLQNNGEFDGYMSQFYWIDGLKLGPSYFGFTDPLTNTWRPQKFRAEGTTVNDGTQWSSHMTSSTGTFYGGGGPDKLFDGLYNTAVDANTNSGGVTFTPPSIIHYKNSVKVYQNQSGVDFVITDANDVTITYSKGSGGGEQWLTIVDGKGGSIKSMSCTPTTNDYCNWRLLEIDGVIMVDSTTQNLAFGTNGFYLPMDNQDDFEKDKSGNGNDFTKNNFSGTSIDPDVVKDSPSGAVFGGRGQTGITTTSSAPANYCTWNPQNRTGMDQGSSSITTSDGNLKAQLGSTGHVMITGNMAMPKGSGKYYWEVVTAGWNTSNQGPMVGIVGDTHKIADQAGGSPSILYIS